MAYDFRNLKIWQKAYELALETYRITDKFPQTEKFSLIDQLRRAAISVVANIAESFGRYHIKDKIHLLMVARGSIYETRSHLSIAVGLGYMDKERFKEIDDAYEILSRQLNSFIKAIKAN